MSAFLNPWVLLGAVLALLGAFGTGMYYGHGTEKTICERNTLKTEVVQQKSILEFLQEARAQEISLQSSSNKIAEAYEKGKSDAQTTAKTTATDLLTGNLRLQRRWAGCQAELSSVARTAAELDAALRDQAESAGRIIAAAERCDAQVFGLQQLLISERKILNKPQ